MEIGSLLDRILIVFFVVVVVVAPLDAGLVVVFLSSPNLESLYACKYGDYLVTHRPPFFVAMVWLEVLFMWPLQLLNLYAILAAKPWLGITSLIFGSTYCTSMLAVLAELKSHPVSDKLVMSYFLFIGCGVLSLLRGLLPYFAGETTKINTRHESSGSGKKRA